MWYSIVYSQELREEILPALVLGIAIRVEFWRPLEKQGKAEWIKYVCCPPQNEYIQAYIKTVATIENTGSRIDMQTHAGNGRIEARVTSNCATVTVFVTV